MRARSVATVAVASLAASLLVGCSPDGAARAASVSVEEGRDAQVTSADGSLVVELPGDRCSGSVG